MAQRDTYFLDKKDYRLIRWILKTGLELVVKAVNLRASRTFRSPRTLDLVSKTLMRMPRIKMSEKKSKKLVDLFR